MILDDRPYDSSASPEEVAAIRARVYASSEDVLCWDEMLCPTPFSAEVMGEELARLASGGPPIALLVDLREAGRPNAEMRAKLRVAFGAVSMYHFAAFTGRNLMLNIAAHFVINGLGLPSHSVHKRREDALEAIANARR